MKAVLRARIGPSDLTVELDETASLRIDSLGRWLSARIGGPLFRRTVDGRVVRAQSRVGPPRDLDDVAGLHRDVQALAQRILAAAAAPHATVQLAGPQPSRAILEQRLRLAADWTAERHAELAALGAAAYPERVEILPPNRVLDVVVIPALGCPNARCDFCAFYRGSPFRAVDRPAFRAHLERVATLFGPALALRRGVFLGSASALSLSTRRLLDGMADITAALGTHRRAAAAFWDPDHCPERTPAQWATLGRAGLADAYVGLETGHGPLRADIGKSGDLGALQRRLGAARDGGIRTHVIVLAGVGGAEHAARHHDDTIHFVESLGLSGGERVFVSALEGSLPAEELTEATRRLRAALQSRTEARVAPYAMRAFRYYA